MQFPELEDWFSQYGVGDLEWDDHEERYRIENYVKEGFDKDILESCFDHDDGPWKRKKKNGAVRFEHKEYDAMAVVGKDDFAFYLPKIPTETRRNELKAKLAGGPAVASMEELVEWQCDPDDDVRQPLYNY